MSQMEDFSIDQLMLFIVGVAGATGGLCLSIQKSKCKKLKLCCGLIDCDRDTQAIIEEEKLALGRMPTPRKEIKLEMEEPEPQDITSA
tara:strand:+ start:1091 stop:1354 length:264 start_codon:yes stop_codon:yes gene_type:complete